MAVVDRLPDELVRTLGITEAQPIAGGDTASAFRARTANTTVFVKTMPVAEQDVLDVEAAGLQALREHAPRELGVPEVLWNGAGALALPWLDEARGGASGAVDAAFGEGLAGLHSVEFAHVGGLSGDLPQRIGSFPVDLTPTDDWAGFLLHRRIEPLMATAVDAGRVNPAAASLLARLAPRAQELAGPPEHPSLLHGDLWAGNRLVTASGRNWLIDPSSFYGHREYDLAMMQLFGGFGPRCFAAYDHVYPLAEGWRDRVPWYQLPPLLVHAIRFGGGYGAAVLAALRELA